MSGYFTESNYENAVLQLLNEELGYNYVYGPDVERDYHSPLYEDVLLPSLQRINKSLPMDALTEAVYKLKNFETGTLLQKNIPDIKCVTPSFSMRLMICSLSVFLRFMQRSSSSLKPNGRFCGRCPVKAQVFILFSIS